MRRVDIFMERAIDAADLLQGYVDVAVENMEDLTKEEKEELKYRLEKFDANGVENVGAKAMLLHLLLVEEAQEE